MRFHPESRRTLLLAALALLPAALHAQGDAAQGNPFARGAVKFQTEVDRDYDLRHVELHLTVTWEPRKAKAVVVETLAPLRDGVTAYRFDATDNLRIETCDINGERAEFTHEKSLLTLKVAKPTPAGKDVRVRIAYEVLNSTNQRPSLNGTYGLHWVLPDRWSPERKAGFWTQGETEGNRDWIPIYDHPNDKTTSETYTTVPKSWFVVGNGTLESVKDEGANAKTYHWSMKQPHATYLLSLAAGEMDVVRDKWQGVDLLYAVPKGEGKYIAASFGDTKDMLSFFSSVLGVKYPYTKYAQTAVFDFGGGMENISATTLGEGALVEARSGVRPMASLNSHELAHQWFGDLITARNWGHIWLNEGFATFFEQLYIEHARGKDAYDRERANARVAYFNEAREYMRPIVTEYYRDPDAMFDSHTYPKGGAVLHMLRRKLGDKEFFRGLGVYLEKFRYKPVRTSDLSTTLFETTGVNLDAFFDQWVYRKGHPVVAYTWSYDDKTREIVLEIQQKQDISDGTPVYSLDMPVGIITRGAARQFSVVTVPLTKEKQTFRIPAAAKPVVVFLDPDNDLLMEPAAHAYTEPELDALVELAPNALDREYAFTEKFRLHGGTLSDEGLRGAMRVAQKEPASGVVVNMLGLLGGAKKEFLREGFRAFLKSKEEDVRGAAIRALSSLPATPEDIALIRPLVNEKEPFAVSTAALAALGGWDAKGNADIITKALGWESRYETLRGAALMALARSKTDESFAVVSKYLSKDTNRHLRARAVFALGESFPKEGRLVQALVPAFASPGDEDPNFLFVVVLVLQRYGDKSAVPALKALSENAGASEALKQQAKRAAAALEAAK